MSANGMGSQQVFQGLAPEMDGFREGLAGLTGPDAKSTSSALTLTLPQIPGFEVINILF